MTDSTRRSLLLRAMDVSYGRCVHPKHGIDGLILTHNHENRGCLFSITYTSALLHSVLAKMPEAGYLVPVASKSASFLGFVFPFFTTNQKQVADDCVESLRRFTYSADQHGFIYSR